jgi:hypothetical protein
MEDSELYYAAKKIQVHEQIHLELMWIKRMLEEDEEREKKDTQVGLEGKEGRRNVQRNGDEGDESDKEREGEEERIKRPPPLFSTEAEEARQ